MASRIALLLVAITSPALASDLAKAMLDRPSHVFQSTKALYEIERCIVMADMADAGIVYRTPDKPSESLIYYPKLLGKGVPVVKLVTAGNAVTITVWHPNGRSMSDNIQACS